MKIELDWKILIFGAILAAVVVALTMRACASEEDRIIRRFEELCALNELKQVETALRAGIKANEVAEYFTTDLTIDSQSAPISVASLRELRQIIFQARTNLDRIDVKPRKSKVVMGEDGQTAAMSVSLRIFARGRGERETFDEAFSIDWVKKNNAWKISKVSRYETIIMID